jgi:ppGpp synthetase/RelA/SpoT-type nucleotidyltranferase
MNELDEAVIRKEFIDLKPLLEEWGKTVDSILNNYLDSLNLSYERVQRKPKYRVKDVESYVSKVLYRKNYACPIKDTTDKVGTRVVLLNLEDVFTLSNFIEKECDTWVCLEKAQDIDKIREQNPNVFTYQSNHLIVQPKPGNYTENQCNLLTCEIQVRTLLQHAYAETSHDTVYKKGHSNSPIVLRSLATTMAFLETADDKIKKIYEETQSVTTPKSDLIGIMIEIYRGYVSVYSDTNYDAGITERLLSLFDERFYSQTIVELCQFVSDNEADVRAALTQPQLPVLFRQPVILFAFYTIRRRPYYLMTNWPFTRESLIQVARAMNISDDAIV